ncbi:MAG: dienelactone hydrolase family protein [Flavitalea sp.]
MTARTLVPVIVCSALIFLSSCQKDVVSTQDSTVQATDVVSSDATANDVAETASPTHNPVPVNINGNCAGYMETLPARYNLTTKQYPLIVFIHGIGELGIGLKINCCGIPYWARNNRLPPEFIVGGQHFSPIYISPQFKVRPSAADVQAVLNYVERKYRVDPTRVYVTGLSMGGGSTLDYAGVYGQNVTAVVPVCGGTAASTGLAKNIASKNIPIWGIYSDGDQVVPAAWGRSLISWMKSDNPGQSANYKLTVYSGLGHNSTWGTAFNPGNRTDGYSLYEWMLRYKKNGATIGGTPTPAPPPINNPTPPVVKPTPPPVVKPTPPPVVSGGNKAPTAGAGEDQVIDLNIRTNAFLNGWNSSDPDGWLNKYVWTKVSGPNATIQTTALTQAHANNLVVGTYVFRLTVTDNQGATATDDIKVTVVKGGSTPVSSPVPAPSTPPSAGNKAPIARAGADQTISLSIRTNAFLNGWNSVDPDGWLNKYVWTKVSGPNATIQTTALTQAHANNLVVGTYVFRLTVTDNKGASASDDLKVVVTK